MVQKVNLVKMAHYHFKGRVSKMESDLWLYLVEGRTGFLKNRNPKHSKRHHVLKSKIPRYFIFD
jgi:hypothetical protein